MTWSLFLPLVLAALLLYVMVEFTRRGRRALARARETARFRQDAAALGSRIDSLLAHLSERSDAARRGTVPPAELVEELAAAADALQGAEVDASAMAAPAHAIALRDLLAQDVGRAARAVALLRHGCEVAAAGHGRASELEAQTSVKRGHLGLVHAREALAEHVAAAAQIEELRPLSRRARQA